MDTDVLVNNKKKNKKKFKKFIKKKIAIAIARLRVVGGRWSVFPGDVSTGVSKINKADITCNTMLKNHF